MNQKLRKLLRNSNAGPIPFSMTLPEKINECTLNIDDLRKLPIPNPPKMAPIGFKYEVSKDLAHW